MRNTNDVIRELEKLARERRTVAVLLRCGAVSVNHLVRCQRLPKWWNICWMTTTGVLRETRST